MGFHMLDDLCKIIKFMFLFRPGEACYKNYKYCNLASTSDGTRTLYDTEGNTICNLMIDRNDHNRVLDDKDLTHYRCIVRNSEIFLCSPYDNLINQLCILDHNSISDTIDIPSTETLEEELFQISTLHESTVIDAIKMYLECKQYITGRKYITLDMSIIDSEKEIRKIANCLPDMENIYEKI